MTKQEKIEAAPSLAFAMSGAFADIQGATKDAINPHFKSKYADLTAVIEAIKPALVKHHLFFTQRPEPHENGVMIETFLHHANGEELSLGKLYVPANKKDAQGFGSALTYARRYALVTAFGVPVEDDDGNAAAKSPPAVQDEMPDDEWAKLTQLIKAANADTSAMIKHYNVPNLRKLDREQYAQAIELLNSKLAGMVKASDEAKAKENA